MTCRRTRPSFDNMPDASEHATCPPRSISAMRHVLVLSLLLLLLPNMSKAQEAEATPDPATAHAMPPAPAGLAELDALYHTRISLPGLEYRTFSPDTSRHCPPPH